MLVEQVVGVGSRVWGLAGKKLEDHAAKRVDVGAGVDGLAADLLRRHVARRALRGPFAAAEQLAKQPGLLRRDGQIDQFYLAVGGGEDVVGLHVAVDPAASMQVVEREGRLRHDPLQPRRKRVDAGSDLLLQVGMGEKLHHQVRQPAVVGEPVDADHRRVGERLRHLELVLEQLPLPGVLRRLRHDHLHGDPLLRGAVDGLPDLALAAEPDLRDELQCSELFGEFCHDAVS